MNNDDENSQIDEGAKEFISVAFIAGLLAIPNLINASDIAKNIPNMATSMQIQQGLKKTTENEKTYGGYTILQLMNILTRTLYGEAARETTEGKKMVATVIWNRSGGDPDKMADVCFANLQFSMWNDFHEKSPKLFKINVPFEVSENPNTEKIWMECKEIASNLILKNFKPLGTWNSYLNPKKANKKAVEGWGTTMTNQKFVGKHKFGYLPEHDGFKKSSKKFPTEYTVKKTDKGVSFIAKNLISQGKTPIKDLKKLTDKIITLNKLGPSAIIHPNDKLELPLSESSNNVC